MSDFDIIIVGGGIVGTTLAAALAKQTPLSIAVFDAKPFNARVEISYHHRVSAIALSSQRIFKSLDIWPLIQSQRISPFEQIQVWDENGKGEIKFDAREIAQANLGFIIENQVMQAAILEKLQQFAHIHLIAPINLKTFHCNEQGITLVADDNRSFTAKLAIAADGAQSWLRQAANIAVTKHDYEQEAIVTTVETDLPHKKIARQVFFETGPLAFLPLLPEHLSSIVWSLPNEEAQKLMRFEEEKFKQILAEKFSYKLGTIKKVDKRYRFPLYQQQVATYIGPRLALLGDAAHIVHPLAGQGVNMGLLDAASLAQVIVEAIKLHRSFASTTCLRRYERWRKADNLAMLKSIDAIKKLFASDKKTVQLLRSFGLNVTNKMHLIKNYFIYQAIGNRKDLPELAK